MEDQAVFVFRLISSFAEHNTVLAGKIVLFYSDKSSML